MLIITADDYGKHNHATDSILSCYSKGRITSASAMVFMDDSERAAELALKTDLEIGLHLNFTMPYRASKISPELHAHLERVITYLNKNVFTQILYNPFLKDSFKLLFRSQQEEFRRLYGRNPAFYNGHHHMHLCANVLAGSLIPNGEKVRTTFTFFKGEKDPFNRLFRHFIKSIISRRFITTDLFFSIVPMSNIERLEKIINYGQSDNVEIEVHPENTEELNFLLSDQYRDLINGVRMGGYRHI